MGEQIVSFKTAELAKEKGFGWSGNFYYNPDDTENLIDLNNLDYDAKKDLIDDLDYYISAPSQSQLQRWLREKYRVHISISYNSYRQIFKYQINMIINENIYFDTRNQSNAVTYEECLESALVYILNIFK